MLAQLIFVQKMDQFSKKLLYQALLVTEEPLRTKIHCVIMADTFTTYIMWVHAVLWLYFILTLVIKINKKVDKQACIL